MENELFLKNKRKENRTMKSYRFAIFLLITLIAQGCAHRAAIHPPIPDNIKIITPSEAVPREIAAFSGWWQGEWEGGGYHCAVALIVESINQNRVNLIYSWGKSKRPKQKAAYDFPPARLICEGKPRIEWKYGKTKLTFAMGHDYKTIVVTRQTVKAQSSIIMHKRSGDKVTTRKIPRSPAEISAFNAIKSGQKVYITPIDTSMRIKIKPEIAFVDEPVNIHLLGFKPQQVVTLRAWIRDDSDEIWQSHASFETDDRGNVDVNSQKPLSGTYNDIDGMGLFWSIRKYAYERVGSFISKKGTSPVEMIFTVEMEGQLVASTKALRLISAPDVEETLIRDGGLVGTLFKPAGPGPFPGIILVSGSGGGELLASRARLLASRYGYATLSLGHTNKEHLPKYLVNIPLEYFETAIHWMQAQNTIRGDRLGILGHSRGGELALLLGAMFPQIKAVVAYAPSSVVWGGYNNKAGKEQSSWSFNGRPLPFVPNSVSRKKRYELWKIPYESRPIFLMNLENVPALKEAMIPVENINGPVLLISGQDDRVWPSSLMSEMVIKRLKGHNHPHFFKHLSYKGSGHNIGVPYGSTTAITFRHPITGTVFSLGGNAKDNAFSNADSWPQVLKFLEKSLKD